MVWWLVFAEIYLVVDYLGLIHVLRNLGLKLLIWFLMRAGLEWVRTKEAQSEVERTQIIYWKQAL